jgi:hypothetical protein
MAGLVPAMTQEGCDGVRIGVPTERDHRHKAGDDEREASARSLFVLDNAPNLSYIVV